VVALLSCFPAVDAAGVFVLVWACFSAVSAFRAVGANIVVYTTILGHVSVPLAFVAPADCYVVPDFARVPGTGRDFVSFCFAPSVLSFSGICGERVSVFLFGLSGFKGCRTTLAFAVGGVSPCDGILGLLSPSTYLLARSESKSGVVLFSPSRFYLCVFAYQCLSLAAYCYFLPDFNCDLL
jgi:hypothetical protein